MLTPTTELEAINQILSGIGEAPVSNIANAGVTDVALARQTLSNVSRQLQSQGWHWNTERGFKLVPSFPEGDIFLPANTLKVDTVGVDRHVNIVLRGQRLYDISNHTYAFTKSLTVDLVVFLGFEDMPEAARNYATLSARRRYQEDQLGSGDLSAFHRRDEAAAWVNLQHAEGDNADYSLADSPDIQGVILR